MPCYDLRKAKQPYPGAPLTFGPNAMGAVVLVPCRQCIGCRLNQTREWALRAVHETQLHERSCFVTLTYSREALADWENHRWRRSRSIHPREHQLFFKRLRKALAPAKVRYLICGEYGDARGRPHYHALLFGQDFIEGSTLLPPNRHGDPLWTHPTITEAWGLGRTAVGAVTWQSASYVASYVTKKLIGKAARTPSPTTGLTPYEWADPRTGEVHELHPEYLRSSRNPGLGKDWITQYETDVYPHDHVILDGRANRPPRYYDKLLKDSKPALLAHLKERRKQTAKDNPISEHQLKMRERFAHIMHDRTHRNLA